MSKRSMKNYSKDQVQLLPFTLIPSSFPQKPFFTVKNVQVLLNQLVHKVAYDKEFLTSSLKRYCEFIYHNLFFFIAIRHYIFVLAPSKLIHLQQNYFIFMKQYTKKDLARYIK